MFRLTLHQASEGDAMVLAWGDAAAPHHAVIDLGRTRDYVALRPSLTKAERIALFAISHVDADHIAGAMPLVRESAAPFSPADVWFNGYRHLAVAKTRADVLEPLSVRQGNKLSEGIERFAWPWNRAFQGGPVSVEAPEATAPIAFPAGLIVTLLGPSDEDLARLEPAWSKTVQDAHLRLGDEDAEDDVPPGLEVLSRLDIEALAAEAFVEDRSPPNGTSITFLAEHRGKRVLLGADAHPSRLTTSLRALGYSPENKLRLDLFKLCHHGSKANTSPELMAMIDCTRFAISTDGTRHDHPDPQTLARLVVADPERPKTFYFNTRQPMTEIWDNGALKERWAYDCVFPDPPAVAGVSVDI